MTATLGTKTAIAVPALLLLATISCFVPIHNFMPAMNAGSSCSTMQGVLFPPTAGKFKISLITFWILVVYIFLKKIGGAPKANLIASLSRRFHRALTITRDYLREFLSGGILHPKLYSAASII